MPLRSRPARPATFTPHGVTHRAAWRLTALACVTLLALAAQAQPAPVATTAAQGSAATLLDLPAAPLEQSLNALAQRTGVQVVFASGLAAGRQAPALQGRYTAPQALAHLLAGSGLAARPADGGKTYVVERAPAAPAGAPSVSLGEVKVTATAELSATTEGSPDYTARAITIGLGEHSVRETPNSVSVVTRQRIEDQNFFTIEDALNYTTAMKVTTYGTSRFTAESRGYSIDRYQIDGVSSAARPGENDFALAMFDRVEVWRGPAGLMQGAGDPGGTLNFARKRAQSTFGLSARAALGSWNNRYGELDVTGPLDSEGRLRGRAVVAYQDREYATDHAYTRQPLFYGTLEYDITTDTTVSVGHSTQRSKRRPFWGLSSYADGGYPDLPRSTFIGALWNRSNQVTQRSFAELEHRLDGGGKAVLSASTTYRDEQASLAMGNSHVDRATGDIEVTPYFYANELRETNLQGVVTWPVQWRGLTQEFILGASHQRLKSHNAYNDSTWGENGFPQNVFNPQPDVPRPDIAMQTVGVTDRREQAVFGQARIRPWQPLVLLVGARMAWYDNRDRLTPDNSQRENAKAIPYAGAVFELSPQWSAYGSYSSIFNPQTDRDRAGRYLAPREGRQVEVGMKGEHLDKRLQSSFGIYRIEDTNRAMSDPDFPDASIAAGKVRSQGVEAELTGRLTPRWNFTAGYGYNTTKLLRAAPEQQGKRFTTTFPHHTLSLWTDYRFDGGWSLAGGARVRSAIFNQDGAARWGQGGLAVYAVQTGWQATPRTRLTLTVNNLLDRKYIDRPDGWTRQSYYGEPRSFMLAVNYKY